MGLWLVIMGGGAWIREFFVFCCQLRGCGESY